MSEKLVIQVRVTLKPVSASQRDELIHNLEEEIVGTLQVCSEVADVGQVRVTRERKFEAKGRDAE